MDEIEGKNEFKLMQTNLDELRQTQTNLDKIRNVLITIHMYQCEIENKIERNLAKF